MSDLIERQEAIDAMRNSFCGNTYEVDKAIEAVEQLPSAEPERKKGKWIYDTERVAGDGWTYSQYHCSECGFQELGGLANFCPHCGVYMRGE